MKTNNSEEVLLESVRDHCEGYDVKLVIDKDTGRECVQALNDGGYNCTLVDLLDLVEWVKRNRPELLK